MIDGANPNHTIAAVSGTLTSAAPGVAVKRLPTYYGVLSYSLTSAGDDALALKLGGDLNVPPGGIVLMPPLPRPLTAVTVNGTPVTGFAADAVTIREFPAEVRLEY